MTQIDYIVLLLYLAGVFAVGVALSGRNDSTSEMFAAGGKSPWWASGLSGFMTMFSAGTFVVWGGIAYKLGVVAIAINACYGVAALLVGYTMAGRWRNLGVKTPAEFVELRFGRGALHFYTWWMMAFRLASVAVALYSLAILLVALMPLGEGNPLRDTATGNLSVSAAILLFGGIVVAYTMIGGLWGVLMTDVLQFIVLNLAVLFVIPLSVAAAGGVSSIVERTPDGFLSPIGGEYGWLFLSGWVLIHYFVIGAEWAFVQRYLCVPTATDARKSALLFGSLYLVSPVVWLLPPLLYRIQSPPPAGATPDQISAIAEQAYINACQSVLPAGMVGLMVAAMFSATASMVSSQLNVFAGVLTSDIYRSLAGPRVSERRLVAVGRVFTGLLGVLLVGFALAVPYFGGAEKVVIGLANLLVGPLLAPVAWGFFRPTIGWRAIAATISTSLVGIVVIKQIGGATGSLVDQGIGLILPIVCLATIEALSSGVDRGWLRVAELSAEPPAPVGEAARTPARLVGWSLVACGVMMAILAVLESESRLLLGGFASALILIGGGILAAPHLSPNPSPERVACVDP